MGLGLYLEASVDDLVGRDVAVDNLRQWLSAQVPDAPISLGVDYLDRPALLVWIHPAAEPVEFIATDRGMVASANTSTVGPGYHAHVVALLDRMSADMAMSWISPPDAAERSDETGFFATRDWDSLQNEMLMWLRAVASSVVGHAGSGYDVNLPPTHRFELPCYARTPMGPRDRDWFVGVTLDPRKGKDIFPWWDQGHCAGYHLGVAHTLMWTQVRWRPPTTQPEQVVLRRAQEELESAFELAPDQPLPWRAWHELNTLSDTASPLADWVAAQARRSPPCAPVGYRRFPVRVCPCGGWSLRIPGEFSEWREGSAFRASYQDRSIQFFPVDLGSKPDTPSATVHPEVFERKEGRLASRALLTRDPDADRWTLDASFTVGSSAATVRISFQSLQDRDWALGAWQDVEHSAQNTPGR